MFSHVINLSSLRIFSMALRALSEVPQLSSMFTIKALRMLMYRTDLQAPDLEKSFKGF